MSTRAKVVFGCSCLFLAASVIGVHMLKGYEDRARYAGVERDDERRRQKQENVRELERQEALRRELEKEQPVSNSGAAT